jgi:hypothetical protein
MVGEGEGDRGGGEESSEESSVGLTHGGVVESGQSQNARSRMEQTIFSFIHLKAANCPGTGLVCAQIHGCWR